MICFTLRNSYNDIVQSEPVCEWCVDIIRFGGDAELLVFWHRADGAHVVQPVGDFDEHYANILNEGGEDLFEVLRLVGGCVVETIQLGEAIHNMADLLTKFSADLFYGHLGVFDDVMEQGTDGCRGSQANFLHADAGHFDGMEEIGFAAFAALLAVGFEAQLECFAEVLFIGLVYGGGQCLHQSPELALEGDPFIFRNGGLNMGHSLCKLRTKGFGERAEGC